MSTLAPAKAKVMSLKEQPQQPSIPSIKLPFPAKQTEYKKNSFTTLVTVANILSLVMLSNGSVKSQAWRMAQAPMRKTMLF